MNPINDHSPLMLLLNSNISTSILRSWAPDFITTDHMNATNHVNDVYAHSLAKQVDVSVWTWNPTNNLRLMKNNLAFTWHVLSVGLFHYPSLRGFQTSAF